MSADSDSSSVAIACQGGGSHTAFTAGVLDRLLSDPALERDVDVVGFSGTSGGAVCALIAWYGREHPDHEPNELLADYWADLAVESPIERLTDGAIRWSSQLGRMGVPLPKISPYRSPAAGWGQLRRARQRLDRGGLPAREVHPHRDRAHHVRPDFDWRMKLERSPELVESLYADGEAAATALLEAR